MLARVYQSLCSAYVTVRHSHVAVVGAGPAGIYVTQCLVKSDHNVDVIERLPCPYGLIRYGVAPDHQQVKSAATGFRHTLQHPRVRLFADVCVDTDVTLCLLRHLYDAVVLAYGCAADTHMEVEGERHVCTRQVWSARDIVSWYNTHPCGAHSRSHSKSQGSRCVSDTDGASGMFVCGAHDFDLRSARHLVVVGVGNVALDVLRVLGFAQLDTLQSTDINKHALSELRTSAVSDITLLARRTPQHLACTTAELRAIFSCGDTACVVADWRPSDVSLVARDIHTQDLPCAKQRLLKLIHEKTSGKHDEKNLDIDGAKRWRILFQRQPIRIISDECGRMKSLLIANRTAFSQNEFDVEEIPCDLLVKAIGYRGLSLDVSLPFDSARHVISNTAGCVHGMPDVFAAGWIATGPVSVLAATRTHSQTVARHVCQYLAALPGPRRPGDVPAHARPATQSLQEHLARAGCRHISMDEWLLLEQFENESGSRVGKVREKIPTVEEMRSLLPT